MKRMSIPALMNRITDDEAAYLYLEELRWGDRPVCPHCGSIGQHYFLTPRSDSGRKTRTGNITVRRLWKCKDCRKQFSVTTGTIMHGSKISLRTWVLVIFEMCASKNGVASREISAQVRAHAAERMVLAAAHPRGDEGRRPHWLVSRCRRCLTRHGWVENRRTVPPLSATPSASRVSRTPTRPSCSPSSTVKTGKVRSRCRSERAPRHAHGGDLRAGRYAERGAAHRYARRSTRTSVGQVSGPPEREPHHGRIRPTRRHDESRRGLLLGDKPFR